MKKYLLFTLLLLSMSLCSCSDSSNTASPSDYPQISSAAESVSSQNNSYESSDTQSGQAVSSASGDESKTNSAGSTERSSRPQMVGTVSEPVNDIPSSNVTKSTADSSSAVSKPAFVIGGDDVEATVEAW